MAHKIDVRPLGRLERIADVLMVPIMYLISGTFTETPQQTHFWNNTKLTAKDVAHLNDDGKVSCAGDEFANARWWHRFPLFHAPLFGGWKEYIVLQSDSAQDWHVGWIADDVIGVSRIKICGPVRVLRGPGDVHFFGVDTKGQQITLREISRGIIGAGGEYANAPLL